MSIGLSENLQVTMNVLTMIAPEKDYASLEDMEDDLGKIQVDRYLAIYNEVRYIKVYGETRDVWDDSLGVYLPENEPNTVCLDEVLFGMTWPTKNDLLRAFSEMERRLNA